MSTTIPVIALSQDLLREIDEAAEETSMTREALIRASVRTFLDQERRWRDLQAYGAERAQALGLKTVEDLEAYLDAFDETP